MLSYNTKYSEILKAGDIFLVTYDNMQTFFGYMENSFNSYIKDISDPFLQWVKAVYGSTSYNLLKFILNNPIKFINDLLKEKLYNSFNSEYIFGFPYIGNGWFQVAEKTGVHIYKIGLNTIQYFDIYRYKNNYNDEEFKKSVLQFWNLPFDIANNLFSGLTNIINAIQLTEYADSNYKIKLILDCIKIINSLITINSINYIGNIELIVRLYDNIGIKLYDTSPEKVKPDELLTYFEKL